MGGHQAAEAVFLERIAATGVPGGKAQERVENAERHGQGQRFDVAYLMENGKQIGQQPRNGNPGKEVNYEAPEIAEDWVHFRASVLDDDAAHDGGSLYDQLFSWRAWWRWTLIGFVNISAHEADAFHRNIPGVRHFDLAAAHKRNGLNGRRVAFDVGLPEVNLKATANGQYLSAFEVLGGSAALKAAENGHVIEFRTGSVRAPGTQIVPP